MKKGRNLCALPEVEESPALMYSTAIGRMLLIYQAVLALDVRNGNPNVSQTLALPKTGIPATPEVAKRLQFSSGSFPWLL